MTSMSSAGLDPVGDVEMSGSSKQRTTWAMMPASRMWERNWLRRPPLGGARAEAGDVDELDGGGDRLLGLEHLGELVEPRVGHGDDADVGVLAEGGEIRGLGLDARQGGEDGGLADGGQADDSAVQGHVEPRILSGLIETTLYPLWGAGVNERL